LSHDIYFRLIYPKATAVSRVIASKMLVMVVALLAALMAALRLTDILQFVSAAFSLAAAAFFPALVMGIFWRRANRAGAVAGMLAGLGVCLAYMALNLPIARSLLGVTARWPRRSGGAWTPLPPACSPCPWACWCWWS
jgi:cation/acetate symporter